MIPTSLLGGPARKPFVTWSLIAANTVMWLAMEGAGGSDDTDVLLDFGAMYGPFIANGDYWRLFSGMFLHVGLVHLLFNNIGLLIFGRMVEQVFGHGRFAIIYVTAGLAGGVASYLFNSIAVAAGASGAVFGVLGALAGFFLVRRDILGELGRQNLSGLLVIAAINLFFGFTTPRIDNWAHIGGLVAGFGMGVAFAPQYQLVVSTFGASYRLSGARVLARRWWVLPLAAGVLIAGTSLGTATLSENPLTHVLRAERYVQEERFEDALAEIGEAIELDSSFGRAYYLRGRIMVQYGDLGRAKNDLSRAIQLGLEPQYMTDAVSLLMRLE